MIGKSNIKTIRYKPQGDAINTKMFAFGDCLPCKTTKNGPLSEMAI